MINSKGTPSSQHQMLTAINLVLLVVSVSVLTYKDYRLDVDKVSQDDLSKLRKDHGNLLQRMEMLEKAATNEIPRRARKETKVEGRTPTNGCHCVPDARGLPEQHVSSSRRVMRRSVTNNTGISLKAKQVEKAIRDLVRPRFVKVPKSVTANEGSDVKITCKATGYPAPQVMWKKDGKPITDSRYHVNGPELIVRRVVFEDKGLFHCHAVNVFDEAKVSVRLVVDGPTRFSIAPLPKAIGYINKMTTLPCKVVGNPVPTVKWSRFPPERIAPGRHRIEQDGLEILRTTRSDAGLYICRSFPAFGATSLAVIKIVPPKFTVPAPSSRNVPRIKDSVKITCEATGDPRPTVTWYKKDIKVKTKQFKRSNRRQVSELVISNFQPQDEGRYKCVARNKFGDLVEKVTSIKLISCGDPGAPWDGFKIGDEYWVGRVVMFACRPGFKLLGPPLILCLSGGNWNTQRPLCSLPWGLRKSAFLGNNSTYLQKLKMWLRPVLRSSSSSQWQRCWHGKTHGFAASTFHSRCDKKGPTVTIVRVGRYIFGGYTDVSWSGSSGWKRSSKSFLFTLYNTHGYRPQKLALTGSNNHYAIYTNSGYGPTFGGGHDLHIRDNANSNTGSYTYSGNTYQAPSGCSRGSCSVLAGSYRSWKVSDIEVFNETI